MGSEVQQLHVLFFPLMAQGHLLPIVDIARLFSARGVKSTILTTPLTALSLSKSLDQDRLSGLDINIQTFQFPSIEAGLPEGCETVDSITSAEMLPFFFKALNLLQKPFELLLEEHQPDFIVADLFLPFVTEVASKFNIPRLVFHGTNYFSGCVSDSLRNYKPYETLNSFDNDQSFIVPGLPDKIELTLSQLPEHFKVETPLTEVMKQTKEWELKSYGVLTNTFYELEPAYADHYKNVMGIKSWHIGPVSLRNRNITDKAQRGKKSSLDENHILNWLNSKEPNSVLYVSFGSVSRFSSDQLLEIAMGLEESGTSFIWVVRILNGQEEERFLPEGFEERIEGKGLIIRDWAPQVLILDHWAVGGFMTHCGWNSLLEGISAGVPVITWPLFAEQFYNEKLVTQVLKIGIKVGVEEWCLWVNAKKEVVKKEKIRKVVVELMGDNGEETKEMRRRAKELGEMAKRAVEEGGSSYNDLSSVINDMKKYTKKP